MQARDHVDVLALLEFVKPDKSKFREVRPLFTNVEVLAVNRTTGSTVTQNLPAAKDERPEQVQTVTLALRPVEAQELILAQNLASTADIWLVLRSAASGNYNYEVWNTDRLVQSDMRLWDPKEEEMDARQEAMRKLSGR